jgi:hypothetical protein
MNTVTTRELLGIVACFSGKEKGRLAVRVADLHKASRVVDL